MEIEWSRHLFYLRGKKTITGRMPWNSTILLDLKMSLIAFSYPLCKEGESRYWAVYLPTQHF